jgi:hypothetical protein
MSANISGGDVTARTGRALSFFGGGRLEIDVGCQTVNSLSRRYRRELRRVRVTGVEPKEFLDTETSKSNGRVVKAIKSVPPCSV